MKEILHECVLFGQLKTRPTWACPQCLVDPPHIFPGFLLPLLTCSPRCQAAPGTCWSHTPAGPARPAAPGTPGSAAPGHFWSLPAVIPRCQSGPAPGPAGSCSGPLSLSGCSPGSLSVRGKGEKGHRAAPLRASPSLPNKSWAPRVQKRMVQRASQCPWLPDLTSSPEVSSIPTRLCWACSSTSRALTVRLSSMISAWQDCSCSELDTTCLFSSSVWNIEGQKTGSDPAWRAPRGQGSWETTCWAAHLPDVPFLHVPAVGLHQGLILSPGLVEHAVEVHSGGSVHLHIEAISQLAPQWVGFLREEGEEMNPQKWICNLPAAGKWAQPYPKCTERIIPLNWCRYGVGINPNRHHIHSLPPTLKQAHLSCKPKSKLIHTCRSFLPLSHYIPIDTAFPAILPRYATLCHICVFAQSLPLDQSAEVLPFPLICLWEDFPISLQVDWIVPRAWGLYNMYI